MGAHPLPPGTTITRRDDAGYRVGVGESELVVRKRFRPSATSMVVLTIALASLVVGLRLLLEGNEVLGVLPTCFGAIALPVAGLATIHEGRPYVLRVSTSGTWVVRARWGPLVSVRSNSAPSGARVEIDAGDSRAWCTSGPMSEEQADGLALTIAEHLAMHVERDEDGRVVATRR